MERRMAKININAAGGTAAKGAKTCKITLPTSWIEAMGLSSENRNAEIAFTGSEIIISCRLSGQEFAEKKKAQGHKLCRLYYYDGDQLCTTITADFTDKTLVAENHHENPVKTAFGNNMLPSWDDFQIFLEERCVPKARAGLREYLEVLGVAEYAPLAIIQQTEGRMAEDHQWVKMEELK